MTMNLTGHKTEAVYRRYAITSAADLSEGVAKLAVLRGATAGARLVLPFATGTKPAQSAGCLSRSRSPRVVQVVCRCEVF